MPVGFSAAAPSRSMPQTTRGHARVTTSDARPRRCSRRPARISIAACSRQMFTVTDDIRRIIMAAIAVSAEDERRIMRLGKRLGVRSKSGVVRLAVKELERQVERRELADALRTYVRKFGSLDRRENAELSSAGVVRDEA